MFRSEIPGIWVAATLEAYVVAQGTDPLVAARNLAVQLIGYIRWDVAHDRDFMESIERPDMTEAIPPEYRTYAEQAEPIEQYPFSCSAYFSGIVTVAIDEEKVYIRVPNIGDNAEWVQNLSEIKLMFGVHNGQNN